MRIPTFQNYQGYSGNVGISKSLPGERVTPLRIPQSDASLDGLSRIGKTLKGIGQDLQNARDIEEITKAKFAYLKDVNALVNEVNTPEFQNANHPKDWQSVVDERLQDLQESYTDNFNGSSAAKRKLMEQLQYYSTDTSTKVATKAIDYEVESFKSNINSQANDMLLEAVAAAGTGDLKRVSDIQTEYNALMDSKESAKVINGLEKNKLKTAWENDFNKAVLKQYIDQNPEQALANWDKINVPDGIKTQYREYAEEQRMNDLKNKLWIAEKIEKENDDAMKKLKKNNEDTLYIALAENNLNRNIVLESMRRRQISPKVGNDLLKRLDNQAKGTDIVENPFLIGYFEEQIEAGIDIREDLRQNLTSGNIKPSTYVKYISQNADKAEKRNLGYIAQLKAGAQELINTGNIFEAQAITEDYEQAKIEYQDLKSAGVASEEAAEKVVAKFKARQKIRLEDNIINHKPDLYDGDMTIDGLLNYKEQIINDYRNRTIARELAQAELEKTEQAINQIRELRTKYSRKKIDIENY